MAGVLRGLLDARAAGQHDEVGERDLLAARGRAVEILLDAFERLQHLRELRGLIDLPILLRREPDARAIGAAAHVGAAEGRGRRPRSGHELRDAQARREDLALERGDVLRIDERVIRPSESGPARSALRRELRGRGNARADPCRDA